MSIQPGDGLTHGLWFSTGDLVGVTATITSQLHNEHLRFDRNRQSFG